MTDSVELELKQQQIENQRLEFQLRQQSSRFRLTPVTATILVAVIGLMGTLLTNYYQQEASLALEQQKFEYSLYQGIQQAGDVKKAAELLDFYVKAGLLEGKEGQYVSYLNANETDKIPFIGTPANGPYQGEVVPLVDFHAPMSIENNFLVGGRTLYVLSPNTSGKFQQVPDMAILNFTASPSGMGSAAILSKKDTKASAHVIVDRDGTIFQMIPFNYIGWHAGASSYNGRKGLNKYSIGIEMVNAGRLTKKDGQYFTWWGEPLAEGEVLKATHKNETTPSYWHTYTEAQIDAVSQICRLLASEYGIQTFVGHDDVSPARKFDPGPAFPDLIRFSQTVLNQP